VANNSLGFHLMKTITLVAIVSLTTLSLSLGAAAQAPQHQILICVSDNAPESVRDIAQEIASHPDQIPLLKALEKTNHANGIHLQSSEALLKDKNLAAYNNLIVIGLPGADPLIDKVWDHYATIDTRNKTLYAQGWGYLAGDLGYIESDRNPFLHSQNIKSAPFETVLVKISGTSKAGLRAAAAAFWRGLINGIVPAGNWTRPESTILDLDPNIDPCPLTFPEGAPIAGWTQVPANEYRAYADIGPAEPVHVWRIKYLPADALDQVAMVGWLNSLQRMAWGNAVTVAEFQTADLATKTATAIGRSHGFTHVGDRQSLVWTAKQPAAPLKPGDPRDDESLPNPPGTMTCSVLGKYVLLSSLPSEEVAKISLPNR
jgi:hypothetical protein